MDKTRLEITPRVWLDHRHAVYLEEPRVLAVSDLHLGYAWAHRFSGQMMPLQPDGVRERLLELCAFYQPAILAVLGDIVHRAVPVAEIQGDLRALLESLRQTCEVKLILGNHDRGLPKLFQRRDRVDFVNSFNCGGFHLIHGHSSSNAKPDSAQRIIMGHEHPAISLGDGVRAAKFPCFLVSAQILILPAFSRWAAGSDIRRYALMSPLAQATRFTRAIAILNGKLLPVRLSESVNREA